MSNIKVMDQNLANKIAAGEVVERCMNVVKELVENAIDAKSTEITIKLIDSGVKEIEVQDNGIGMDKEDAILAFSRHATSKLKKLDDLFYIESLGFRGEALSSIASVSDMEMITSDGKTGTKVTISGGENLKAENCDLQLGTIVRVKNLFYNTPVRLKYLKNLYTELANIIDYINKMALAHPNIKFTLMNNGKVLLSTDGKDDLLKVIYSIYGVDVTKKMIPIEGENDDYYISGYISYPEMNKSNRNSLTTLVNGRVIKNNELNKTIIDAYHTYMHKDRYPIVILNIDVDPILIDINIHPTKMDIKFSKIDALKELVTEKITERLEQINLIPEISVRSNTAINEVKNQIQKEEIKEDKKEKEYEEIKLNFEVEEEKKEYSEATKKEEKKKERQESRIKKMTAIGVVLKTYIIAENEDGMYVIDQHAAAERINYEKILKKMKENVKKIDLLVPIKIELKQDEMILVKEKFPLLEEYGFEVEDFGFNTIVIRTHPAWIKDEFSDEIVKKLVDIIISKEEFSLDQFIWRMSATTACRMSVMAGDYISKEEQDWILENIRYCENPFTCPHGRPTIIAYSKKELEHQFKRILDK